MTIRARLLFPRHDLDNHVQDLESNREVLYEGRGKPMDVHVYSFSHGNEIEKLSAFAPLVMYGHSNP